MKRPKLCKRCRHRHTYRDALCWTSKRGMFVCRCRNHRDPKRIVADWKAARATAKPKEG